MTDTRDELARRWATAIRANRTECAGITQEELADILGVTVGAVRKWEQGQGIPADYIKIQLIQILGLDPFDLFAPVGPMEIPPKIRARVAGAAAARKAAAEAAVA